MSEERIRRLEEQVAELYSHLGLRQGPPGQSPGGMTPEVEQLVNSGKKINAIKLLREQTGLGLAEAKDMVDEYERRYRLG
jgi:large subunit ribosomal protein L7/L12